MAVTVCLHGTAGTDSLCFFRVDEELWREVGAYAVRHGLTVKQLINREIPNMVIGYFNSLTQYDKIMSGRQTIQSRITPSRNLQGKRKIVETLSKIV